MKRGQRVKKMRGKERIEGRRLVMEEELKR